MKLLMIRFSALGDVAMLVPVVGEVVNAMPEVEVTVLSQPRCAPLFEGLGERVSFIGADIRGEYRGLRGLGRLFRRLDAMGFDCVADMHGVLRTHYLALRFRLAGYRVAQIDKQRSGRRMLTAPAGEKVLRQLTTSFEKYRDVLHRLPLAGLGRLDRYVTTVEGRGPVLRFDVVDDAVGRLLAGRHGLLVGVAPFAAHGGKIYPLDRMEMVVEGLLRRVPEASVFLFGGGGMERDVMLEWEGRWPGRVVAASPVLGSMRQELQLMSRLGVMLSMDSANMHLASLVGIRVVSVWGSTHPFAGFLGWQQRAEDCVQADLPCRPCSVFGNKPCRRGDFACMNSISPESIVERIVSGRGR